MEWYFKLLVHRPYLIISFITLLSLSCIILSLTTNDLPDFSNPTLGFEARGTYIGQRLTAWYNLLSETRFSGILVDDPRDLQIVNQKKFKNKFNDKKIKMEQTKKKQYKETLQTFNNHKNKSKSNYNLINKQFNNKKAVIREDLIKANQNDWNKFDYEKSEIDKYNNMKKYNAGGLNKELPMRNDSFFCGSLSPEYSRFVIRRIGKNSTKSLFNFDAILALCKLEKQIQSVRNYDNFCERETYSDQCCRAWSISNYVALLANKASCFNLTNEDVISILNLLTICSKYFNNFKLSCDYGQTSECEIPRKCKNYNAVYNIFHYLSDVNFMKPSGSNDFLEYTMLFIPVARSANVLTLFHQFQEKDLKTDLITVAAMDLGVKNALFEEMLLTDSRLVAFGLIFIVICIWCFTSSLIITLMTFITVLFSVGMAYFVYKIIFDITFFPFMNALGVIVIIGIGSDDAFIFVKLWHRSIKETIQKDNSSFNVSKDMLPNVQNKEQRTEKLNYLMTITIKHAALSMFVTSLTTAVAFYSSVICSITSVKCFGIYAGTAIVLNYLLMITLLPASVLITEKLSFDLITLPLPIKKIRNFAHHFRSIAETCILNLILKFSKIWIILFGSIGTLSLAIILYWPGLQLPNTSHFQLFTSGHPFEIYDVKFKNLFAFEKLSAVMEIQTFPLRFVWGIKPIDDGDFSNPHLRGKLHFDNHLNLSAIESQVWLLNFCSRIRNKTFYMSAPVRILFLNCFIENFVIWMNRKCIDRMDDTDRSPCCESSKFPFSADIFDYCLPLSISSYYSSPRNIFLPGVAGPKFLNIKNNYKTQMETNLSLQGTQNNKIFGHPYINRTISNFPELKAFVIEFDSNVQFSMSYFKVKIFVDQLKNWFDREILSAPIGLKGGWFTSELEFFDLQETLSKGTVTSIGFAMCTSLMVLLIVTLNILISFYAIITIIFTISVTVAVLILFGWKLNILESISISTAIGLAVDFSLHYGINYRLSPNDNRLASTIFSIKRILGPTSMAAFTTAIAGAIMLASEILVYNQIGIFLVVIMIISWLYSTLFLMSLLKNVGPQHGYMQFSYPKWKYKSIENNKGIRNQR